ncbi:hypothetical protein TNCV_4806231 [Trichonephila clavipes]|nr:hypothetical protein TNCV_4806231 [Trichonephila clavipes]
MGVPTQDMFVLSAVVSGWAAFQSSASVFETIPLMLGLVTKTPRPAVQVLTHSPRPSERLIENRPVLKRLRNL